MLKIPGLVKGTVIKRPSAHVRTPYVADIKLTATGRMILGHTISLGCGGMINAGECVYVAPVSKEHDPDLKCSHRVYLAVTPEGVIVGTDPKIAEDLVEIAINKNLLDTLRDVKSYKREVVIDTSRFDFAGVDKNGRKFIMEVKNVPLAADRVAYFPDGYRRKKSDPVSVRALKHVRELIAIRTKTRTRCIMCYVVQRADVDRFKPADADPEYQEAYADAVAHGVEIVVMIVGWSARGVATFLKLG
jgi:sugar fermentation stimulation protein A